ncbi:MAG TPA: diguanylate cyclase [Gaiellales bacterium]|nr:diguanylate cyclase [Gaiellales bacterium]
MIPRLLGRRLLWAGMVMAVVTLIVGAVVGAQSATDTSLRMQRGGDLAMAYERARAAVVAEQNAEAAYWASPTAAGAERVDAAASAVVRSLRAIQLDGTQADGRAVQQALADQTEVAGGWQLLRRSAAAGDIAAAGVAQRDAVLPWLRALDATLTRASVQVQGGLLVSLGAARQASATVLVATVFAFVFGLLLIVAGMAALHYKRRLDAARELEFERMRRAALTDSLTGLHNHRAFHDDLGRLVRAGDQVCLVLLDLDGLRSINDRLGHRAGDEHIRLFAAALAVETAEPQAAYRIGGDRFAVLLPGQRPLEGLYLVSSLQQRLRAKADGDQAVGCTAGVAETTPGVGKDTLLWRADLALVEARRSHRQALVHSPGLEALVARPAERRQTDNLGALATSLARAVDAKDAYTHSHCETVAELCGLIAEQLGLSPERVARVRLAGLLHDVGKIGIPDAILRKPGPLTDAEYASMKQHPTLGHHILSAAELGDVADWILHHHERVDGCGYPDGLSGEAIPFESRIVMVADAFEAITADRPYRDSRSVVEAIVELERHSGTQFDPRCLVALKAVVGTGTVTIVPADEPALAA